MKTCKNCNKQSWALNKNNICIVCAFALDNAENESKIFKETGIQPPIKAEMLCDKKSCDGCDEMFCSTRIFKTYTPMCSKCNKPVDHFGPLYMIEYGATRIIFVKCHGEIEVRMFNEYQIKDGKVNFKDVLSDFFFQ